MGTKPFLRLDLQVADMIRHIIDNYDKTTPAILEIPSKEHAYDPSKDFILKRAQVNLAP
jgi:V-type H+-transporting ATPase subunit F